jgi:glycosyltransferase involved in cell wall biosynthesis
LSFAGKGCEPNGSLKTELNQIDLVQKLISDGRLVFEFQGQIFEDHLREWFESIDLYFMASDGSEGFPNSLAEALTIGIPSISTSQGESTRFLPPQFICNGTEPRNLSEALSSFYNSTALEITEQFSLAMEKMQLNYGELEIKARYRSSWLSLIR